MKVLEELKRQAEKAQTERLEKESVEDSSTTMERRLITRVDDLYHYFKELQNQLSVVNPEVIGDFYVTDMCTLTKLRQQDYQIHTDDKGSVRKFAFHYNCVGSGARDVKFPSKLIAEQRKEPLLRNNLKFRLQENAGHTCSIIIEAFVPVSFEFRADVKKAAVALRVKNKPMLGVSNYSYEADQINSEFMDEVAKYILDKPNRFDELSGNTIPEDTLMRIRQQLEQQKAEESKKEKAARTGSKDSFFKSLFGKKSRD